MRGHFHCMAPNVFNACEHAKHRQWDEIRTEIEGSLNPKQAHELADSNREYARTALAFLRLASTDTQPKHHTVGYYTSLCLKYGATLGEISNALLGESDVPA